VHGVIFTSNRDYVTDAFGSERAADTFAARDVYLLSESYPDEELVELIERTSEMTATPPDELLHDFGVFTAQNTFARLYPAFFAISPSTRAFLLTVETRIHELVRATIPNAGPPQLDVSELGDDGVAIVYASPRRLCVLLRGLTEGTARHYGERSELEETTCMKRGDAACTFQVRFSREAPPA
jgi:hypothetical protein